MKVKSPTRTTMTRLIPPLTIWAIGRILDLPSVKGTVMQLDGETYKRRHDAARSFKKGLKNARSNASWVAAGAAAMAIGIGLVAKAAASK
jgi:hypothetical protein